MKRAAVVIGRGTADAVSAYLPGNYRLVVSAEADGRVMAMIEGEDHAGWTMEDYVEPRFASGLYATWEMSPGAAYSVVVTAREMSEGGRG